MILPPCLFVTSVKSANDIIKSQECQWGQEQVAAAAAEIALEQNEAESHSSEDKNS
jgi:hypothetical protein